MTASVKNNLLYISPGHRAFWLAEVARRMFAASETGMSEEALNKALDAPRVEFNGLSAIQAARQSVFNFRYAEGILNAEIG